jgi:thiol:disulfide interchange protein DsbD
MKHLFIFLFAFITFFTGRSQQNPVTWQATYKSISASEGEVVITATIEKGWHTYSQRATDAGPIPTSFKFDPNKNYTLVGKTEESNAHEEYVKAFEAKIFVFTDKAEFRQKVKLNGKAATINCKVEFMSCNDMMCLPPKTVDLIVKAQ